MNPIGFWKELLNETKMSFVGAIVRELKNLPPLKILKIRKNQVLIRLTQKLAGVFVVPTFTHILNLVKIG